MESEGRRLHGLAAEARERGEHLESLRLSDEALLAYGEEGNDLGFSEVLADRSIVFRHLNEEKNDKKFLYLARAEMTEAVRIARESGNPEAIALPIYQLGNVEEDLGNFPEAIKHYGEAVDNYKDDRPAYLATIKVHLTTCQYKNGDKSALDRAIQALTEIEASDEEKYNKDVWLSGARMRIADMLREDNPEKAKEHLQKAKDIIDSNPDLKLRAKQWEKLAASF